MGNALPHQEVCDCNCLAGLVDDGKQVLSAAQRADPDADAILDVKRKVVHYFLWGHRHTAG